MVSAPEIVPISDPALIVDVEEPKMISAAVVVLLVMITTVLVGVVVRLPVAGRMTPGARGNVCEGDAVGELVL